MLMTQRIPFAFSSRRCPLVYGQCRRRSGREFGALPASEKTQKKENHHAKTSANTFRIRFEGFLLYRFPTACDTHTLSFSP
jgi:hypothetical protein